MNPRHLLLLTVACLALAGCLPESKNPLSLPSASRYDPQIEGVFRQIGSDEVAFWHFRYRRENRGKGREHAITPWIDVLSVGHSKDGNLDQSRYDVLATQIGGGGYLSFITLAPDGSKKRPASYSFARYDVNWRGDVRIWLANEGAFVSAVKAGKLRGKVTSGQFGTSVELTDTTANLAAFIAAGDPKALFEGEPMILRREAR